MIPTKRFVLLHLPKKEAPMAEHQQQSTQAAPIDTSVSPPSHADRTTPRAQTRYDYDEDTKRKSARMSVNLAGMKIPFKCGTWLS